MLGLASLVASGLVASSSVTHTSHPVTVTRASPVAKLGLSREAQKYRTALAHGGATAACIAAASVLLPDMGSVNHLSYNAYINAAVAVPVVACWVLPFFAATDLIEGNDALEQGMLKATAPYRASPSLPDSKSPWASLSAFAKDTAARMAPERAMMALEAEQMEEQQQQLASADVALSDDMACVMYDSEEDGQLQWVCL
jgi:hypothetical protein